MNKQIIIAIAKALGLEFLCKWHQTAFRKAGRAAAPEVPAATANAIADAAVSAYWTAKIGK
jgi:hypothetical protein